MKTYVQPGETLELTAPSAISSGDTVQIGGLTCVAVTDIASGAKGSFLVKGVMELAALSTDVFAEGDVLYWDPTASNLTIIPGDLQKAGICVEAKAATVTTGKVLLNAHLSPASSHYVAFSGEHTTVGGAAAEAITVTGALDTDIALVTLHTVGSSPVTILTSLVSAADTLTVTFSADPSSDHVVSYVIFRAV